MGTETTVNFDVKVLDPDVVDPYENPKDAFGSQKAPLHLVPPVALVHESLAMRDGAVKYGPYNWRNKRVMASIYLDALARHVDAWFSGEEYAPDSGVHHLAHARACLGILLDAMEHGMLVDDRPQTSRPLLLLLDAIRDKKIGVSGEHPDWVPGEGVEQ